MNFKQKWKQRTIGNEIAGVAFGTAAFCLITVSFLGGLWLAEPSGPEYPCTVGERVLVGHNETYVEFIESDGTRSIVLDKIPVYECRLPDQHRLSKQDRENDQ